MAVAGVRTLRVGHATAEAFLGCWPDCKGHMARLGAGFRCVEELFKAVGYDGPAECFTMWCCLFTEPGVRKALKAKGLAWLTTNLKPLRVAAAKYREAKGLWPHPSVLLSEYRKAKTEGGGRPGEVYSERALDMGVGQTEAMGVCILDLCSNFKWVSFTDFLCEC